MSPVVPVVIAVEVVVAVLAIAYAIYHGQTNVDNLRSFTPTCPNCGREIRATDFNEPHPKARLRDHYKECEAS